MEPGVEFRVVAALAPLVEKYGREEVGKVLKKISETLLTKIDPHATKGDEQ